MLWIGAGAVVVLTLIAVIGVFPRQAPQPGTYDAFATCLTEKNVSMYGAYWCPHCQNQKKMFGDSWDRVAYVECAVRGSNVQAKICQDAGIKGYPTWVFSDGSRVPGEMSFAQLSEKTGCALTEFSQ